MLTVNADEHPVMREFHPAGDEKRTPVVLAPERFDDWLSADPVRAMAMLNGPMPDLKAMPAPRA